MVFVKSLLLMISSGENELIVKLFDLITGCSIRVMHRRQAGASSRSGENIPREWAQCDQG